MSRFKISRRIGRGGMAEVFLALQEGIGDFEKLVVVKRIFPHFCEDAQFVRMFLREARLAAALSHPNIVEILDVRRDDGGFYIAMEYLSGETISYVAGTLFDSDRAPMPIAIACRIAADVAEGLHYAHTARDEDGVPREVVHRDVTPSNLLVCYSGVTKILDFGVAKASADREDSRPGTLKGKVGYLAPEQLEHGPVDARVDVFQLGVVLHEMLTGRRLFRGANEHKTMMAVLEQPIAPPSAVNPGVPEELDAAVLEALARHPDERTPSADVLRAQLEAVLAQLGEPMSHHGVATWMKQTFADRFLERQALERQAIKEMREGRRPDSDVPAMFSPFDPTAPYVTGSGREERPATVATVVEVPGGGRVSVQMEAADAAVSQTSMSIVRPVAGRRRWLPAAVGAAGLVLAGLGLVSVLGASEAQVPVTETETVAGSDSVADSETVAETETVADSETVAGSDSVADSVPVPDPASVTGSVTEHPTAPVTESAPSRPAAPRPAVKPRTDNRDPWSD